MAASRGPIKVFGMAYSTKQKALLVDYEENNDKKRCKKISFKKVSDKETVDSILKYLHFHYPLYFSSPDLQESEILHDALRFAVEDLLADFRRVQSLLQNIYDIDLNKVSEEDNRLAKLKMNEGFESKRLKPGDIGFEWDKRIDFSPPEEVCEWDED